ncbi:MAG: YidC/Oxa1 family membrane protein insertase [Spirochaetaceae bacterium]|nr:YidC/Oxa1 family membrane protein insertase [Spirochaetaceae bacterium]
MNILYNIIIYPIVQIIEIVFVFTQKIFKETGISIIAVSCAVSVLCLPLYNVAERWQKIERDIQKKLKPKTDKIRAVFRGDERYMILSAYYRQNSYHPVYAMRNTFSLLIQIPFFIAAYSYLSHLELLKDARFLFINDLGSPDGLLKIGGGGGINLLPLLMTLINVVSGAVYTRGLPARDKAQLYGMAAVFLVLLYNSPAGLVLYWTCNNIFSLGKNCIKKIKSSEIILLHLITAAVFLFDVYVLFFHDGAIFKRLLTGAAATIILAFMISINSVKKFYGIIIEFINLRNTGSVSAKIFFSSAVILFLLSGFVIPSALIASSTEEFSFITPYDSPFPFIGTVTLQAAGIFIFWFSAVYFFFSKNVKQALSILLYILSVTALINTFVFPGDYGFLSLTLTFSNTSELNFHPLPFIFNLLVLICAAALCLFLALSKRKTILFSIQAILIISLTAAGLGSIIKIKQDFSSLVSGKPEAAGDSDNVSKPVYYFSRTGKNVIVIMLDRAISGYLPYIFEERPDLRESFEGFTWYPNCVSLGGGTLFGLPPLFGGYDYSPDKFQKQDGRPLVKKWNEALLVLPRLFSENGFYVTVTDPTCANFEIPGNLSIYNAYPNIHAENLHDIFTGAWLKKHTDIKLIDMSGLLKNKLMRFSFFKMSPLLVRVILYDKGKWMVMHSFTTGNNALSEDAIDNYAMLDALPEITKIDDSDINTYTAIVNELTHASAFFEAPDYVPSNNITNFGKSQFADENHYHVNMAALVLLGKWFDYLKAHGVYDNTRIIISADHGWNYNTKLPNFALPNGVLLSAVNPLLLVKDFNDGASKDDAEEREGIKTDYSFMSHADIPYMASRGITDTVNPFTRNSLFYDKTAGIKITTHYKWEDVTDRKYKWNINSNEWLYVHDNIFDPNNWGKAEK